MRRLKRYFRQLRAYLQGWRQSREQAQADLRLALEQQARGVEPGGLTLTPELRQQAREMDAALEYHQMRAQIRASQPRARGWLDKTEI